MEHQRSPGCSGRASPDRLLRSAPQLACPTFHLRPTMPPIPSSPSPVRSAAHSAHGRQVRSFPNILFDLSQKVGALAQHFSERLQPVDRVGYQKYRFLDTRYAPLCNRGHLTSDLANQPCVHPWLVPAIHYLDTARPRQRGGKLRVSRVTGSRSWGSGLDLAREDEDRRARQTR